MGDMALCLSRNVIADVSHDFSPLVPERCKMIVTPDVDVLEVGDLVNPPERPCGA